MGSMAPDSGYFIGCSVLNTEGTMLAMGFNRDAALVITITFKVIFSSIILMVLNACRRMLNLLRNWDLMHIGFPYPGLEFFLVLLRNFMIYLILFWSDNAMQRKFDTKYGWHALKKVEDSKPVICSFFEHIIASHPLFLANLFWIHSMKSCKFLALPFAIAFVDYTSLPADGFGEVNPEGVAYYNKLIDSLLEKGASFNTVKKNW